MNAGFQSSEIIYTVNHKGPLQGMKVKVYPSFRGLEGKADGYHAAITPWREGEDDPVYYLKGANDSNVPLPWSTFSSGNRYESPEIAKAALVARIKQVHGIDPKDASIDATLLR